MNNVSIISDSNLIKEYIGQLPHKMKARKNEIDYVIYNNDFDKDNHQLRLDEKATMKRIDLLLKEKGLSNRQVAELLGVTNQAVNNWRHHHLPDVANLYALSCLLEADFDELLVSNGQQSEFLMITPSCSVDENILSMLARVGAYYKMIILLHNK